MFRIAQESLVANRQHQLRNEAEVARLVSRVNHRKPRIEQRVRSTLALRLQFAR